MNGELENSSATRNQDADAYVRVAALMETVLRRQDLFKDPKNYAAVMEPFSKLNARIFLRFIDLPRGKRTLRKAIGGVVTFGTTPAPMPFYLGATSLALIKYDSIEHAALAGDSSSPAEACSVPPVGKVTR